MAIGHRTYARGLCRRGTVTGTLAGGWRTTATSWCARSRTRTGLDRELGDAATGDDALLGAVEADAECL